MSYKDADGESHQFFFTSFDTFQKAVLNHLLERMTPYLNVLWMQTIPGMANSEGVQKPDISGACIEIPGFEITHSIAAVVHENDRFRLDLTRPGTGIKFKNFQPGDMSAYDIAMEVRVVYTPAESSLGMTSKEILDLLAPAVQQLQVDTGLRDRLLFWIVVRNDENTAPWEWYTAVYNEEPGGMEWIEGRHIPEMDMGVYLFGMDPF